jgi:hypothetical protein
VGGLGQSVQALADGAQHLVLFARGDQVAGADGTADLRLGVAENLGKAGVGVAEEIVLDDVDADHRVAQQADKQAVCVADQVFGQGALVIQHGVGHPGQAAGRYRQRGGRELLAVAFR